MESCGDDDVGGGEQLAVFLSREAAPVQEAPPFF